MELITGNWNFFFFLENKVSVLTIEYSMTILFAKAYVSTEIYVVKVDKYADHLFQWLKKKYLF